MAEAKQGPFVGSRCLAGPSHPWAAATIRRVNEDGTFTLEFDVKDIVLQYWYGATLEEISFNDAELWPDAYKQLNAGQDGLSMAEFGNALERLGNRPTEEQLSQLWHKKLKKLNIEEERITDYRLDRDAAYQIFLQLGISAKMCAQRLKPDQPLPYTKLYWNQIRMGGRNPAEGVTMRSNVVDHYCDGHNAAKKHDPIR